VKKLKSGISFFLSACIMIAILCPITAANGADVNTTASVSQLAARHYEGQTILTWNEIPEVAAAVPDTMTPQQVKELRASFNYISYRIYRSTSPITSVTGLSPIKTVNTLTGWDDEFYGRENSNVTSRNCPRFVVEKDTNNVAAAPVSANTAVSAYNPVSAGTAYYAVTVVRNGVEETLIDSGNTVMINETVGQGIPILQKVETQTDYFYTNGISTHYYYTRWESPPNSNVQGMPQDYKVIVPQSYRQGTPAPVYMSFHGWSSSMHSISAWWLNYSKGTIVITSNENPYDWWTGYHEKYGIGERSQQNWSSGVVRPYTQNRLNSFYDWAAAKWSFDRSRTISGGVSMGGSGSVMYGIRNPDRIAWVYSWVGVHVPAESPTFRSSYQGVYGQLEWQIKYEDGVTPAFSFYDDDWYLRNHISDDTPFITFSNGKNDSGIGWSQAVKFVNALQDTKRPHIFYWGMGGHNQRTLNPPDINGNRSESLNPIDIRTDQSLPAFTNCSLDDDPGNGNTNNGDESGQINAYMFWKTDDIVDTQSRWEMTVGVVQTAPAQSCTVSLTPRRLQNFDPVPGKVYRWTNTSLSNNAQIQSGTVTCDSYGLLTINDLTVNRINSSGGGNRIVIYSDDGTVPVNNPPVLAAIGARTVRAGETLTITVNASDPDQGDTLVYSACTSPSGSLPQGASFNASARTLSWTPQNDQSGEYSILFSVSDGKSTDSETITITVTSAPDEPPTPGQSGSFYMFEEGKTPTSIIHVATNGNDSTGNGSAASPFRSISRALQAATPGTAIRIHPGTYSGRINISGLSGTAQAPIWIGGAPGEARPVITSSSEGIHLTKVRYLILHDLEISNTPENAINCDDGGEYNNMDAARYLIFRDLYIHDVNTSGNEDGIKLSGVNDYYILDCEITNCGNQYGSGIDHVGCHNGIIAGNYLHGFSGTGITCKGGSENIHIRGNRLFDCGERAVNIGGSTDFAFFRPSLSTTQPNYEAKNIHVYSNLMKGSIAPIAFVGAINCSAVNNTVISPENWLIRILQERTSTSQYTFGPCSNNTVANNIFYYNGSALSQYGAINVGSNTSPATFTFSNNLWYNYTSPQNSKPNLPVTETNGIYGQDPLFTDLAGNNVNLHTSSPALGKGVSSAAALYDYNGVPFGDPRNIGVVAGSSSAVQNQPPVLAAIGAKTVASGSLLSFTASASDPDAGTTLVYSVSPVSPATLPSGISINSATGAFSWTPGQNQCGTFTVRITVSDGALSDSENVMITVFDGSTDLYSIRLKYIPVIDSAMKANLRAIKLRGDEKGRDEGVLGQWGDSITHSQAYLGSMASWGMISTPPSNGHDYEPILLWMGASPNNDNNPLHNFKGGSYGNDSGWRITNGLAAIDNAIAAVNPSWSLTMFGTNDITSWDARSYETNLERFININIDEGIIPVLSTIPPRTNYDERVIEANTIIRRVAQKMNIPLVDLYGLFMELHPNDWSSVLLSDGIHPSHSYGSGDLSDSSLRNDGYNIRSVLTLDMAEKLKRIVFDNGPADGTQTPVLTVSSSTHPYKTMTVGLSATFNIRHDSGPVPGSYSWVLDQYPDTTPDTVSEGSSTTVTATVPGDGTWYFHVRGSSGGTWGPAAHYCIIASEFPRIIIKRTGENPGAVRDTYISRLWGGDDNFGAASSLNIYNDDAVKRTQGLFRFDLTGVDKNGITSARLKLYTSSPVTKDFDYEIYAINGAWTEGTGTWNNGDHSGIVWNDGLTYSNAPVTTGIIRQGEDCIEADVTTQVLAWLNGAPNNGLMLQHLELWSALEIISSENGMQDIRPSLTIVYNTPAGQWNYAPVLDTISAKTVNEGANLTFTISATDRDQGDTLTYSMSPVSPSTLPAGISFNSATRVFSWTPGYDQSGTYTLRFTVSDGKQIDYEDVVITVRNMSNTPPQGRNVRVSSAAELRSAIANAQDGDTILIANGEYRNGSPLILNNVDNISIRSESNDPTKVTLRGRSSFTGTGSYDELDDILRIGDCNNVHISGLTLAQAHGYGIKLELDGNSNPNGIYIENCRFIDIGTRHIKGTRDSNSSTKRITGGAIRNCYFENTVTPPSTGGWRFDGNYTGAVDMMSLDGWVIEDNVFKGIQGYSGEGRSAIMIWYFSEDLTIQRNRIINCDRGITLGLPSPDLGGGRHVKDAIVRNNFILPGSKAGYQSDAGIECSDVDNVRIYNNTIWRLNNDYNGRGIRFIKAAASTEQLNSAINKAVPGKDGVRSVTLTLPEIKEASTYQQEIPADIFRKGTDKERYVINTPVAIVSVPGNMFPAALTDKKQQIGISVSYADRSKLKKELADKIGSRPVINIVAYSDGKQIEWNNKNAPVKITINYTPTAEELKKPDHIVVWYIDGKGNAVPVPNGRYDPVAGKLTFTVTHQG
jgi:hypothetical protein